MGIVDMVKSDMKKILGSTSDFAVPLTITNGVQSATITGTTASHFLQVDPETGLKMRGRNNHVTVSMGALTDAGYTFRDVDGEVALVNHRVTVQGVTLVVRETFPDETFASIVLVLGDFI
jgi:hypothetical protein